jgi:nucleoside-diphosphate-sugar epimerase
LQETTANPYLALTGHDLKGIVAGTGPVVDVRDVAKVFVAIIEQPEKANGERFITASAFATGQAYLDILNKQYPEKKDIIKLGEPNTGYMPGYATPSTFTEIDNTKVPKVLGLEWIPFEKTVIDSAKAFEKYI